MDSRQFVIAAFSGDSVTLKRLAAQGVDLNSTDNMGLTALHWAAVKDDAQTARILLELGVDQNIKDKSGRTALQLSRAHGKWAVFRLLEVAHLPVAPSKVTSKEVIEEMLSTCPELGLI